MRLPVLAILLATAGCIHEESPQMRPGEDCLRCHGGGEEDDAPTWTVAGTVYADPEAAAGDGIQGAVVRLTDSKGRKISLGTNGAGNFYTRESLSFPVNVEVVRGANVIEMPMQVDDGACNSCHKLPPAGGAPGRIYAP